MPKKRHNAIFANPTSIIHPTLISSRNYNNDRSRSSQASSSTAESPSVNDLINHLRRTQVSGSAEDGTAGSSRMVAPRSVHPSLRNLLELPETPPPRPRPGARRIGVGIQRLRRTPGPPPPESWLLGGNDTNSLDDEEGLTSADTERIIYRLERLPGTVFPPKHSLLHMLLKSMALHWSWHVVYDGQFLSVLPSQIKVLLLSYLAVYARDQPLRGLVHGLKPLFSKMPVDGDESQPGQDTDPEISRLDLSGALGRWMTLKQLTRELVTSRKALPASVQRTSRETVPSSWEDDLDEQAEPATGSQTASIPAPVSQGLRFENLRFLSLAHPKPVAVNWNDLISLLSRLSTLTHLSLAHWPVPTVTPNAVNARIRHPTQRSLTFAYGGTDAYSAMEDNWGEAAGILRRLSRATYCLKWLDLEGCGDWTPALTWNGTGPDGEAYPSGSTGPEWNASWRDIEWIRLGPGWLPHIDDNELFSLTQKERESENSTGREGQTVTSPPTVSPQSLAASIHAPSRVSWLNREDPPVSDSPEPSWDVEVERIKYRRSKELERYREIVRSAQTVQRRVLQTRREGRGKWAQFSFGFEELDDTVLRKLLGPDYSNFFQ